MFSPLLTDSAFAQNKGVRLRYEYLPSSNTKTILFVMGLSIDAFGWSNAF